MIVEQKFTPPSDKALKQLLSPKDKDGRFRTKEELITNNAFLLWINSQIYKQRRMQKVSLYERLYNNEIPRKERQLFNICIPILGGFEDALMANLTDPIQVRFDEQNPADYLLVPKIQAQWKMEKDGLDSHQMWDSKATNGMHDALLSGRCIMRSYAENMPEYRHNVANVNYSNFHCQPLGGDDLENHTFVGEEGIYMTMDEILVNESFPKEQREKISKFSYTDEWWQYIEENYGTSFARFRSLGLNISSNTFTGVKTLYLNQFIVLYENIRWYVLFDPISQNWLRCEPLEDVIGTNKLPYYSFATHPDAQNFWNKGFSDDIFQVAITISTLINQELTNREKKNFNARAYDPTMFTDEAKLDAAQYRPDALVPVDTNMGVRKIEEGIYSFETAELQGTVDLSEWLQDNLSKNIGITDLTLGAAGVKRNAQVILAQQQQVAKRIGFKAEPVKRMWARISRDYVGGLKNFMPTRLRVKLIGEDGFTEEAELKRSEMRKSGDFTITVTSSVAEQQENEAKTNKKMQALTMVAQDPNVNSKWRTENTLKFAGWEDVDIAMAMDTQTYGSKKMIAKASAAIEELLRGKMPDIYYGADMGFLNYIKDFVVDNQDKLMKRKIHPEHKIEVYLIALFIEYSKNMLAVVQKNELRKQKELAKGQKTMADASGQQDGTNEPGGAPVAQATATPAVA